MENILFKISFPAEFHAQTAVEAAMTLHAEIAPRLSPIERVVIETQEPGMRIIDKTGPLNNPADRDHCLQYMVAIPLLFGRLQASDYEDETARDPRIDELRSKMLVTENAKFTEDYYSAEKRYIGNAVQVFFEDGTSSARISVDVPIGHRRRRAEGDATARREIRDQCCCSFRGQTHRVDHEDVRGQYVDGQDDRERLRCQAGQRSLTGVGRLSPLK